MHYRILSIAFSPYSEKSLKIMCLPHRGRITWVGVVPVACDLFKREIILTNALEFLKCSISLGLEQDGCEVIPDFLLI